MSDRVAILDTDFLIKTYNIKNSNDVPLAENVLKLDYNFYCHSQVKKEIKGHNNSTMLWLNNKVSTGIIKCYTDLELVELIQSSYHLQHFFLAASIYSELLKKACGSFSLSFFEDNYFDFEEALGKNTIDKNQFEKLIELGDKKVGEHNNLGEIKSYLLTLVFDMCSNQECFVFCSDDKKARRTIIADCKNECVNVRCVSVSGLFLVIKNHSILTIEESRDFLDGWIKFNRNNPNVTIETIPENYQKMNIKDVFDGIWNEEFELLQDGFLCKKIRN